MDDNQSHAVLFSPPTRVAEHHSYRLTRLLFLAPPSSLPSRALIGRAIPDIAHHNLTAQKEKGDLNQFKLAKRMISSPLYCSLSDSNR